MLMTMATDRLEPSHIKQLLLYAPDAEEVKQYEEYRQDPSKLSEVDQFVLQVSGNAWMMWDTVSLLSLPPPYISGLLTPYKLKFCLRSSGCPEV